MYSVLYQLNKTWELNRGLANPFAGVAWPIIESQTAHREVLLSMSGK